MNSRENLINDIDSFLKDSMKSHNVNLGVQINEYFALKKRIFSLTKDDFKSDEDYGYFLRYINQPERKTKLDYFEISFMKDNSEGGSFLFICDFLSGVKNRSEYN